MKPSQSAGLRRIFFECACAFEISGLNQIVRSAAP